MLTEAGVDRKGQSLETIARRNILAYIFFLYIDFTRDSAGRPYIMSDQQRYDRDRERRMYRGRVGHHAFSRTLCTWDRRVYGKCLKRSLSHHAWYANHVPPSLSEFVEQTPPASSVKRFLERGSYLEDQAR